MSSEAKRVKILTLIELALGLIALGYGISLAVLGQANAVPVVLGAEGVFTLLFGGRGALVANVPARIGKLATLALVALVVQALLVACMVLIVGPDNVGDNVVPIAAGTSPAMVTLAILLLSRGMAKRRER